jgi:hypothetical protein
MKNKPFVFFLLMLISNSSFSQKEVFDVLRNNSISDYNAIKFNTSDYLFGYPKPNTADVNIGFYWSSGKRINFEISNIQQLNEFKNFDSLFLEVRKNIKLFTDSFKNDALTHRIDYVVNYGASSQFRVINNIDKPNSYTNVNGELMQLKVDMDTLRIKINLTNSPKTFYNSKYNEKVEYVEPIVIQFILKNLSDIESFSENVISSCVKKTSEDVGKYLTSEYRFKRLGSFNFTYNMNSNPITLLSPSKANDIRRTYNKDNSMGILSFSTSVQFLKGQPVSSLTFGVTFPLKNKLQKIGFKGTNYFQFDKDISGNSKFNMFNFIELSYRKDKVESTDNRITIKNELSFGYLLRGSSNFLKPNTFYIGLPYVKFGGAVQLRPELYFSKDYWEPSIKLTLFGF